MRSNATLRSSTRLVHAYVKCFHSDTQEGLVEVLPSKVSQEGLDGHTDDLQGVVLPFRASQLATCGRRTPAQSLSIAATCSAPVMIPAGLRVHVRVSASNTSQKLSCSSDLSKQTEEVREWAVQQILVPQNTAPGVQALDAERHRQWRATLHRIRKLLEDDHGTAVYSHGGPRTHEWLNQSEQQILSWITDDQGDSWSATPGLSSPDKDIDDVDSLPMDL